MASTPPRSRLRIKICCIASLEEARLAIAEGADALGLVAAMPSGPGPIDDDQIRRIAREVPPPVATFLLTSRSEAADVVEHVARCEPSTVQVVRHVDPAVHEALARRCPQVRRVQVIHVADRSAVDLMRDYQPHVHALLLDSGRPAVAGGAAEELGGTGRTHDWTISAEVVRRSSRPVFLAGGLSADNVARAVATVRPFGVDLCSGVRTNGVLDAAKLRAFVKAARGA